MEKPESYRWHLIRDTIIFQLKLGMDAVRDLLLSPVSFICVIFDLLKGNNKEQSYFYRLMKFGHKTDVWLNLFNFQSQKRVLSDIQSNKSERPVINT